MKDKKYRILCNQRPLFFETNKTNEDRQNAKEDEKKKENKEKKR